MRADLPVENRLSFKRSRVVVSTSCSASAPFVSMPPASSLSESAPVCSSVCSVGCTASVSACAVPSVLPSSLSSCSVLDVSARSHAS